MAVSNNSSQAAIFQFGQVASTCPVGEESKYPPLHSASHHDEYLVSDNQPDIFRVFFCRDENATCYEYHIPT